MSDAGEPEQPDPAGNSDPAAAEDTGQPAASDCNNSEPSPNRGPYRFHAPESMITHGTTMPPYLTREQQGFSGYQVPNGSESSYGNQSQYYDDQQYGVPLHVPSFNQFNGRQVSGTVYYPTNQDQGPVYQIYGEDQYGFPQRNQFMPQSFPVSNQPQSIFNPVWNGVQNWTGNQFQVPPYQQNWLDGQPQNLPIPFSQQAAPPSDFVPQYSLVQSQRGPNGTPISYNNQIQHAPSLQPQFVPQNSSVHNQPETIGNPVTNDVQHPTETMNQVPSYQENGSDPQNQYQTPPPKVQDDKQQGSSGNPASNEVPHVTGSQASSSHQSNGYNGQDQMQTPLPSQIAPPNVPFRNQTGSNWNSIPNGVGYSSESQNQVPYYQGNGLQNQYAVPPPTQFVPSNVPVSIEQGSNGNPISHQMQNSNEHQNQVQYSQQTGYNGQNQYGTPMQPKFVPTNVPVFNQQSSNGDSSGSQPVSIGVQASNGSHRSYQKPNDFNGRNQLQTQPPHQIYSQTGPVRNQLASNRTPAPNQIQPRNDNRRQVSSSQENRSKTPSHYATPHRPQLVPRPLLPPNSRASNRTGTDRRPVPNGAYQSSGNQRQVSSSHSNGYNQKNQYASSHSNQFVPRSYNPQPPNGTQRTRHQSESNYGSNRSRNSAQYAPLTPRHQQTGQGLNMSPSSSKQKSWTYELTIREPNSNGDNHPPPIPPLFPNQPGPTGYDQMRSPNQSQPSNGMNFSHGTPSSSTSDSPQFTFSNQSTNTAEQQGRNGFVTHFEQIAKRIEDKVDNTVEEMKLIKKSMISLTRTVRRLADVTENNQNERAADSGNGTVESESNQDVRNGENENDEVVGTVHTAASSESSNALPVCQSETQTAAVQKSTAENADDEPRHVVEDKVEKLETSQTTGNELVPVVQISEVVIDSDASNPLPEREQHVKASVNNLGTGITGSQLVDDGKVEHTDAAKVVDAMSEPAASDFDTVAVTDTSTPIPSVQQPLASMKKDQTNEPSSSNVPVLHHGPLELPASQQYSMFGEEEFPVLGQVPACRKQKLPAVTRTPASSRHYSDFSAITFNFLPRPTQDCAQSSTFEIEEENLTRTTRNKKIQRSSVQQTPSSLRPMSTKSGEIVTQHTHVVDDPMKARSLPTPGTAASKNQNLISSNSRGNIANNNKINKEKTVQSSSKNNSSGRQGSSQPATISSSTTSKKTEKADCAVNSSKQQGNSLEKSSAPTVSPSSVLPKLDDKLPPAPTVVTELDAPEVSSVEKQQKSTSSTDNAAPEVSPHTSLEVSEVSEGDSGLVMSSDAELKPILPDVPVASSVPDSPIVLEIAELSETEPGHLTKKQKRELDLKRKEEEKEQRRRNRMEKEAMNRAKNEAKRNARNAPPNLESLKSVVRPTGPEVGSEAESAVEPETGQRNRTDAEQEALLLAKLMRMAIIGPEDAQARSSTQQTAQRDKMIFEGFKNIAMSEFKFSLPDKVNEYVEKQRIFRRTPEFRTVTENQTELQSILMYTEDKYERFMNLTEPNTYFLSRIEFFKTYEHSSIVQLLLILTACDEEIIQWDHFCIAEASERLGELGILHNELEYFVLINGLIKPPTF